MKIRRTYILPVPDRAIDERRRLMWTGMTTSEYRSANGKMLHQPTGITLQWPAAVQWTVTPGPYLVAPAPPARWLAELHINRIPDAGRAYQMRQPCSTVQDHDRFRRRFGSFSTVERLLPMDDGGSVPWDADLIIIVANLFFVSTDLGGYNYGHPAFPDKLEFAPPQLRASLRRTVVNPFARPANRLSPLTWVTRRLEAEWQRSRTR
jgi:hypothetical protein